MYHLDEKQYSINTSQEKILQYLPICLYVKFPGATWIEHEACLTFVILSIITQSWFSKVYQKLDGYVYVYEKYIYAYQSNFWYTFEGTALENLICRYFHEKKKKRAEVWTCYIINSNIIISLSPIPKYIYIYIYRFLKVYQMLEEYIYIYQIYIYMPV